MVDNVQSPEASCPDDADISDTTGLEVSTRAIRHSVHGPATSAPGEAVDCTTARRRQRIDQPFWIPSTTGDVCEAAHGCPVKQVSPNVVPCPDQIRPLPC
ncbi:hypothetical protein ACWDRB_63575, partial [Nonomuraea sp. NPDC003707]